jgi:glycosyltransferase 2 family protein
MAQGPGEPLTPDRVPNLPAFSTQRRISLLRLLGTLLSLGLLIYLIAVQGWDEFTQVISRMPGYYLWLALFLMLLSRIAVTLRWYVLLRSARVPMRFIQCLRLTFMGLFASNFLPSTVGGDLVRLVGAIAHRFDPGISAASLVLDRLIGMAGMSSLAPIGLVIVLRAQGASTILGFPAGLAAGFLRLPGFSWIASRLKKYTRSMLRSSAYWLRNPSSLLLALLCTYSHMLFTFLILALLLHGMHQTLPFWWIAGLWSLSYFISLAPISINGLGLQELSISVLYTRFGGVSPEAGLALAIVYRFIHMLASMPGVIFLPDILRPPVVTGDVSGPPDIT